MPNHVFASLLVLLSGMVALSSSQHHFFQPDQPAPASLSSDQFIGHRQLRVEYLPENINLGSINLKTVDEFLANRPAVLSLVHCFMDERVCQTRGELNFVRQIKTLGRGGQCFRCTAREQTNIRAIMRRTVAAMQRFYPAEWRALVPIVRNILY